MSSQAPPKRKMSQTVSFVGNTNPEILKIEPRPGGAVTITPMSHKTFAKTSESAAPSTQMMSPSLHFQVEEKISKEFRVQTALEETESIDVLECSLPNPLRDAMFMFGVTVSGLIMMASGHAGMPEEYPQWIKKCLESVRDDFGNHPPNVQGVLNHLKHLESTGKLKSDETKDNTPVSSAGGGGAITDDDTTTAAAADAQGEPNEADEDVTVKTTTRLRMGSKDES